MKIVTILIGMLCTFKLNAQIYTPTGTIQGASGNTNVGIGTSNPSSQLSLTKVSTILGDPQTLSLYESSLANYGFAVNGPYGGLDFCANQAAAGTSFRWFGGADKSTPKQLMVLLGNGNVGIGTTIPSQKLEVNGNTLIKGIIMSSFGDDSGGNLRLVNSSKNSNGIANSWAIYNMTGTYGNSLQFWAYDNLGCTTGGMCNNRFTIMDNGNVGIGSINPTNKLDVKGSIHSQEVKVDMIGWSDFVFKKEYTLPTLAEVEKHIVEKGHLENIPSEEEVLKNGINLGEMNSKLLQKIEELTLYMIEIKKENEKMKKDIEKLKSKN